MKIKTTILFFLVLFFGIGLSFQRAQAFAGGDGSISNPYQITTAAELASLSDYNGSGADNYYKLMNDINLDSAPYNVDHGWMPIGSAAASFLGHLDGDGKTISGLYIYSNPSDSHSWGLENYGLFGVLGNGSSVYDIKMENISLNIYAHVVGALAGKNLGSIYFAAINSGNVIGGLDMIGGLVGENDGILKMSFSNADVQGRNFVGGLVGKNYDGLISESYTTGQVWGASRVGGVVGQNIDNARGGKITDTYSRGSVGGSSYIGGIAGHNGLAYLGNEIKNSYATGALTATTYKGGIAAINSAMMPGNFWDVESTDLSIESLAIGSASAGTGKTTAEMQTQLTFSQADWDFDSVWKPFVSGYPELLLLREIPAAPEVTFVKQTGNSAELSWALSDDGGAPITGYELKYSLTGENNWQSVSVSAQNTYTLNLSASGTYDVQLRAQNDEGFGNFSSVLAFEIVATPVESLVENQFHGGGVAQGWRSSWGYWQYDLPFPFKFYGQEYTTISISTDGYIAFTDQNYDFSPNPIDYNPPPLVPVIAAMSSWGSVVTDANPDDDIYITNNADGKVIFRWQGSEYGNNSNRINFEIVLNSNNSFQINYGEQTSPLPYASSVGINNGNGLYVFSQYDGRTDFNQLQTSSWGVLVQEGSGDDNDNNNNNEPVNVGPTPEKFLSDIISGFISVVGGNAASAEKITFTTDYTIIAGESRAVLPAGTEMTKTEGGVIALNDLDMEDITAALKNVSTANIAGAINIGISNLKLSFSKNITLTIPTPVSYNGQTLDIYYRNEGETVWTKGTTCLVADGKCVFQTNHATQYSAGENPGEITIEKEKAKITSWKAYQYKDKTTCDVKLKLVIKGKHFKDGTVVKIGNKEASEVNIKNSRNLTAKFCMEKLFNVKTRIDRKIYVINPGTKAESSGKRINISTVNQRFSPDNFSMQNTEGIKNIQRALFQLGFIQHRHITGAYGPITKAAVMLFQSRNGIEQTGLMEKLTKDRLARESS